MHTKLLHGVKGKQANQPNNRVGCQNAPTCSFTRKHRVEWRQHEFIYSTPGGVSQSSQPLNQRCLSCAGHTTTTRYFRGESVGAGINFEAESRNCSLADCRRSGSSSCLYPGLPGPQVVLEVPPTTFPLLPTLLSSFPSSQESHLCRPSVGISHSSLPTQDHIPFLGVNPMAGVPLSILLALLPLSQKLDDLCLAACLTRLWFLFSGQWEEFGQICVFAIFYGAEECSSGFLSPMPQTAFSLVSSHQLS